MLSGRVDLSLWVRKTAETPLDLPVRNILAILKTTATILRHTTHKQIYNSLEVRICSLPRAQARRSGQQALE